MKTIPYGSYTPEPVTGMAVEVYLQPPQFDAAVKLGQEMDAVVGGDWRRDPNGVAVADKFVLGMLGEYAFAQFLHDYGIRYEWDSKADGKSDEGDFVVYWQGKPVTIDVKTLRGHRQSILLSEREYGQAHTQWRYVVVRQGGGSGRYFTVEGICKYADFQPETFDDGRTVYKCPLRDLNSIGFITTYCDKS